MQTKREVCFIGFGSNLGNRRENIGKAIDFLNKNKRIRIKKVSSIIETAPQGITNQPKFLNGVLKIQTSLTPLSLLKTLREIEERLGRARGQKGVHSYSYSRSYSARRIDLDILLYGNKSINNKNLKIPHPRMWQRRFVLQPLHEVAPRLQYSQKMRVIKRIDSLRRLILSFKKEGKTIGFVPTMGFLHRGHLLLLRQAKKDTDVSVMSIFVNPAQFGPQEDFLKYPRDFKRDERLAREAGVDIIFYPSVKDMYPKDYLTSVEVERLTKSLCGASRPTHFKGVTTIVAKLFNIVQPDRAYFGQKDAQQAIVIKKMVNDLNFPITIKVMPIVREKDGLAMSSRNNYLTRQERKDALVLYKSLQRAKKLIQSRELNPTTIKKKIKTIITKSKSAKIDYVEIVDTKTLESVRKIEGEIFIALAVWIEKTRLIDNVIVKIKN